MRIFVYTMLFASLASAQPLSDALQKRIAGFPGAVTLYARNLDTGESIGIRPTDPVRTASTIKLPILCAVFDQVAAGKAKWTDPIRVTAAAKVPGSGIIASELSDGLELPLRDVANLMIVLSDNSATNLILDRVPANTVNAYLDRIGLPATRSLRKVMVDGVTDPATLGWSAAGKLAQNQKYGIGVSTPRDMVAIIEKLARGEIVSPEASRDILAILKRCKGDTSVRRRLGDLDIANKTGGLDALRSDVALVWSKGGRIAMAITVDDMPKVDYSPDNPGALLIADLAKLLVDGLARK